MMSNEEKMKKILKLANEAWIFSGKPRDVGRIPRLCALLTRLWMELGSDLRFFQFIHNLSSSINKSMDRDSNTDLYWYEDSSLIRFLEKELSLDNSDEDEESR